MKIIYTAMFGVLLSACANQQQKAPPEVPVGTPPITMNGDLEAATIKGVQSSLKDPDSAKVTSLVAYRIATGIRICGFVNAKNSYGGYAGNAPFYLFVTEASRPDGTKVYIGGPAIIPDRDYVGYLVFYQMFPACKASGYVDPESLLPR